ncbi:HK97 family phage prohead protease [Kibdelosporangium philippinense]|uniref:HK97 family phage prohead protease n=1 Tax=Kibdelosporangium philippinense TaxID=211113 RepID=A0ABS8ZLS2_9PSEU|nr:HK97 family phage prohead protease [Kibdelosporangium philippinense]MCE7008736.1 HK97 family phage prohead protease [Kibdelosporangium philippinense]
MNEEELRTAATARAGEARVDGARGYRAPADRPSRRRCAEDDNAPARVSVRVRDLEIREAGSTGLQFRGYASVTDAGYEMWDMFGPYTELVSPGAFSTSLARSDLDVPLVLQHQDLRRIARTTNGTLQLAEDDTGLLVEADLDPDDHDVQYIVPKLRRRDIDEMSFKFRITAGQWSPDWMEYHINDVDIHRGDVAIVGYGANPHTAGAGLRAADPVELIRSLSDEQARAALAELNARLTPPRTPRALITDEDTRLRVIR